MENQMLRSSDEKAERGTQQPHDGRKDDLSTRPDRLQVEAIDPDTADVAWWYVNLWDPYGTERLPDEFWQVGREYFARAPGADTWVWFGDLPTEVCEALRRRPAAETDCEELDIPF
jgi:hypothetical protein